MTIVTMEQEDEGSEPSFRLASLGDAGQQIERAIMSLPRVLWVGNPVLSEFTVPSSRDVRFRYLKRETVPAEYEVGQRAIFFNPFFSDTAALREFMQSGSVPLPEDTNPHVHIAMHELGHTLAEHPVFRPYFLDFEREFWFASRDEAVTKGESHNLVWKSLGQERKRQIMMDAYRSAMGDPCLPTELTAYWRDADLVDTCNEESMMNYFDAWWATPDEDFAESFAEYVTCPNLLAERRPERAEWLHNRFGSILGR